VIWTCHMKTDACSCKRWIQSTYQNYCHLPQVIIPSQLVIHVTTWHFIY